MHGVCETNDWQPRVFGIFVVAAICLTLLAGPASAQCTWIGPAGGEWLDVNPDNWACPPAQELPTASDDVLIPALVSPVLATGPGIQITNNLRLESGAILDIRNSIVSATGSTVTNDGEILVDTAGGSPGGSLFVAPAASIDATVAGVIVLDGDGRLTSTLGGAAVTQGANHVIRGAGVIDANLVNNGLIIAEPGNNNVLELITGPKQNNRLIRVDTGATLSLSDVTVTQDNANGRIFANGGTVDLNAATISGGSLFASGAGQFTIDSTGTIEDVVNNAPVLITPAGFLFVRGTSLTNNNTISVSTVGGPGITRMFIEESVALEGSGEVLLNSSSIRSQLIVENDAVVTQTPDHSIRGVGIVNGAASSTLLNEGLVEGFSDTELLEFRGLRVGGEGLLRNVEFNALSTHAPGDSTGGDPTVIAPLEETYAISSASATLEIEVAGTTPGDDHDQLSSTGTVDLGGQLDVVLIEDFVPASGDRFTIITASTVANQFLTDAADLPNAPNFTVEWDSIEYNANSVVLEVLSVTPLPGDYNGNGVVDAADYTVWRDQLGQTGRQLFSGADGNGDGDITIADYELWRTSFGDTVAVAAVTAAPEPAAGVLTLLAVAATVMRGSRRRPSCCG